MEELIIAGRKVPYLILRKKIKNTYLRVKPEGYIQVTTHARISHATVVDFIRQNERRIINELERLGKKQVVSLDKALIFGAVYPCRKNHASKTAFLADGEFVIPDLPEEKAEKKAIEAYYGNIVWQEAMRICIARGTALANEFDLSAVHFKTQRMKSQFGSCQPQKNIIKLNTVLGRFDPKYLDAILLHEICHLRVQNHGPEFYRLLLEYVPEYRKIRRELNRMVKTIGV
jgi:hypothetical protein